MGRRPRRYIEGPAILSVLKDSFRLHAKTQYHTGDHMINLLPLGWLTGLLFSVFSIASTPVRWTAGPTGCPWAATGTGGGLVRRRGGCGRGGSVYTHAAGAAALQQGRGAGVPIAISAVARGGAAARRWKLYAYPVLGNVNSARRRATPPRVIWHATWPVS